MRRPANVALALVVLVALALGWRYATTIPKWNQPDEPAHFNYVRQLATTGTFPILQFGDYDHAMMEERMGAKFPDRLPNDWIRYESHQPPLYYALATPVYLATQGMPVERQVVALRMFSALIGALGLVLASLLVRQVFPKNDLLAVVVPGVMAFVPMRVAIYAAVENDALAEVSLTAVLLALVVGLRRRTTWRYDALIGLLVAAALLTKLVDYISVGLVAVAYFAAEYRARLGAFDSGRLARRCLVTYGVAVALAGWWFARNLAIYGWPDLFGLRRHDAVVAGQPLTSGSFVEAARRFGETAFHSFWAQFGWMGILVDDRIYRALYLLCGVALVGLAVATLRVALRRSAPGTSEAFGAGLLVLSALGVTAGVIFYNLTYLQPQGRYFFPALPALSLGLVVGLRELCPTRLRAPVLGLLVVALAALSLLCLIRFVEPAFAGG